MTFDHDVAQAASKTMSLDDLLGHMDASARDASICHLAIASGIDVDGTDERMGVNNGIVTVSQNEIKRRLQNILVLARLVRSLAYEHRYPGKADDLRDAMAGLVDEVELAIEGGS